MGESVFFTDMNSHRVTRAILGWKNLGKMLEEFA